MKVLVCGGRTYTNGKRVYQVLDELHAENAITLVIEGGARGADMLAGTWADQNEVPHLRVPAKWKSTWKGAAGPIRNSYMLTLGEPELVVAFPGGIGTADCVQKARIRGIEVREIE